MVHILHFYLKYLVTTNSIDEIKYFKEDFYLLGGRKNR